MTLFGIKSLGSSSIAKWEDVTQRCIEDFYSQPQNFRIASNVATTITLVDQKSSSRRARVLVRRILQSSSGSVVVSYDQELTFTKGTSSTTVDDVASGPFDTIASRNEYVSQLSGSDSKELQQVNAVTSGLS